MSEADGVRDVIRQRAYRDDTNLMVRHRLHGFATTPFPSPRGRLFAVFEPSGDERVIDVGCGNGQDLSALAAAGHRGPLIGVDLSTGMLRNVGVPHASLICGDAVNLPLASDTGDLVLAMSMLYHVTNSDHALAELRRVLRPGGTFMASASSASNMSELVDLWEQATIDVVGRELGIREIWSRRFNIENGTDALGRSFDDVELHRFVWQVDPPVPAIVRDYAESSRDFYEHLYPSGSWEAVMERLESLVRGEFDQKGGFMITIRKGIFVAR